MSQQRLSADRLIADDSSTVAAGARPGRRGSARRVLRGACACLAIWLLAAAAASAQGLLVNVNESESIRLPRPRPRPEPLPQSYKIKSIDVNARLADQVARVQVSQTFVNTGSGVLQASFVFPLPYDGAIDQLTLLVDGKEYAAKLLPKDEARRIYEEIVRKNQDPALLEWMGTGMFQTSVFPIPPGAERTVTLRYSQLCRQDHGLVDFLFPLSTAKYTSGAIDTVDVRVAIQSPVEIKNIYSPTHAIEVERTPQSATVSFSAKDTVPANDFRLFYDVGDGKVGARVVSYRPDDGEDGYFLLLASPEMPTTPDEQPKKSMLFVIDRSGSMSGKKIEQAKAALRFVLNNLREGDLFNVIAYDSAVESFRPELQKFDDQTRQAALGFVEGLYAGGSTNIDGALGAALGQLTDGERPGYVLFLTDGLPTVGETDPAKIVAHTETANKVRARVVSFGVGYDVNARLLDKLARVNHGQSEYVRPDEDIEDRVSKLFRRIESPVLTDVQLTFDVEGASAADGQPVNRLYPSGAFDLFSGEQLVVVGRYRKPGTAKVAVAGNVGGETLKFDFPIELAAKSADETNGFVEKLWAVRRIGEIIDELDLKGNNPELVTELVALSTRHGVLTPYTSFLADETTQLNDLAANARETESRLRRLGEVQGPSGVSQRATKQEFLQAGRGYGVTDGAALGGGAAFAPAAEPRGAVRFRDAGTDELHIVDNVRQIGNRAFYSRENVWWDSTITDEQRQNARRVKQFSDEYFKLAERHGRMLSQYLALDEPVCLNLDGEIVLIEVDGSE